MCTEADRFPPTDSEVEVGAVKNGNSSGITTTVTKQST